MPRPLTAVAFLLLLTALLLSPVAQAAQPERVPEQFALLMTAPGVAVYGNESVEEAEEYVQVLDLSRGARLEFWHGSINGAGRGEGLFGGASPRMTRHYLPDIWLTLISQKPDMICLANGQFFRDTVNGMWVDPTELAFPLKSNGVVISEGYERRRFRSHRVMLELWNDHAAITPLNRQAFSSSTAPDIIVGLDEWARVRATEELGRTIVAVSDGDGDGINERLLIYSGAAATQGHAIATLRSFGAQTVMMLDGGGSAQLSCDGASFIRRVRPLPSMMATVAGGSQRSDAIDSANYLTFFEKALARWLRLLQPGP